MACAIEGLTDKSSTMPFLAGCRDGDENTQPWFPRCWLPSRKDEPQLRQGREQCAHKTRFDSVVLLGPWGIVFPLQKGEHFSKYLENRQNLHKQWQLPPMRENVIQSSNDSDHWEWVRYDLHTVPMARISASKFPRIKKLKLTDISVNWSPKPEVAVLW